MTPEQIQQLRIVMGQALRDPLNFPWAFSAFLVILMGVACYLGAYFGQKAKNQALKEDIEVLTDKVQAITAVYTERVELLKANLQYRNVSLPERLKAHQEAYSLWFRLFDRVWDTDRSATGSLYQECRKWWADNCLYLEPDARHKFMQGINLIMMHQEFSGPGNSDLLKKNWSEIEAVGDLLAKSVQIPEQGEAKLLQMPSENNGAKTGTAN